MDVLKSQWKNLSLTKEECEPIKWAEEPTEEDDVKSRISLLGKLCSNRRIGKDILQTTMGKIWKISRKPIFKEINQNLFTITFGTEEDKKKILEGRP